MRSRANTLIGTVGGPISPRGRIHLCVWQPGASGYDRKPSRSPRARPSGSLPGRDVSIAGEVVHGDAAQIVVS